MLGRAEQPVGAPGLNSVMRQELAEELQSIREGKARSDEALAEALSELGRCRTQLLSTQEELRACKAELADLKLRQQPKVEMPSTGERYACFEGGEGTSWRRCCSDDACVHDACVHASQPRDRRRSLLTACSEVSSLPEGVVIKKDSTLTGGDSSRAAHWREQHPLQAPFPEHDFSMAPLEITLEQLKESLEAFTDPVMAWKLTELSPGQSLQEHVVQRPEDDPMWVQFEVRRIRHRLIYPALVPRTQQLSFFSWQLTPFILQDTYLCTTETTLRKYGYKDRKDAARKVASWWRGETSVVGTRNDSTPVIQQATWLVSSWLRHVRAHLQTP
jgi:hypothetical protein